MFTEMKLMVVIMMMTMPIMMMGDDDDDDDDFDNNGPWQGRGRSRGAEAAVRTIGRPRHQEYCLSSGSGYSDPVRMRRILMMSLMEMMIKLMRMLFFPCQGCH